MRTHGAYVEASRFVYKRPSFRASFGARAEMLLGAGEIGWGALARGAAELYQEGTYAPDSPICVGSTAAQEPLPSAVYAENGYERLPNASKPSSRPRGSRFAGRSCSG